IEDILEERAEEDASADGEDDEKHRSPLPHESEPPAGRKRNEDEHRDSAEPGDIASDLLDPFGPQWIARVGGVSHREKERLIDRARVAFHDVAGELDETPDPREDDEPSNEE